MALSASVAAAALPLSLAFLGLAPAANAAAPPAELRLDIRDFGAVADGASDCTEAVRMAIRSGDIAS